MAFYRIEWKRSATRELKNLPKDAAANILRSVTTLAENPFPEGVRKVSGAEHTFRIRRGSYRVIYTVSAQVLLIEVIRVGHRKDVYR
ncbi:MAG: type II toxin-antitoxin system RelE family toxin [Bryobacteraceae bacterium]